jgi:rhomboid family GlyGly-CTERM serine protease
MGLAQREASPGLAANWWLPATFSLAALVSQLVANFAPKILPFERAEIGGGEIWRLVTGHFVHLGWSHLLMNLLGLVLVWALVGRAWTARQWLVISLVTMLVIDVGFCLLLPELSWYVGMSGLLHGLLTAGLVPTVLQSDRRSFESLVLAVLVAVKLAYEQFAGAMPGSSGVAGGTVIVDAHLYGAIGGVLAGVAFYMLVRRRLGISMGER